MHSKISPLIFLLLSSAFCSKAQTVEYRLLLGSNLFHFAGQSAASSSFFNYSAALNKTYTNNPYGSQNGLGKGLGLDVKRITKKNWIWGSNLSYEYNRSKTTISLISGYTPSAVLSGSKSYSYLDYQFINVTPSLGKRLVARNWKIDLSAGFDFSFCTKAWENGRATAADGQVFFSSLDRKTIKFDLRPRMEFSLLRKYAGIHMSYSHGLNNYKSGYIGGINSSFARIVRMAVSFQIG